MRGWKVTAGLAVAALLAAFVAPRLLASFEVPTDAPPAIAPIPTSDVTIVPAPESPMIAPTRDIVPAREILRPAPVRRAPPAPNTDRAMQPAQRPTGMIPEIDAVPHFEPVPPQVPVPVEPIDPDSWPDMIECGMG